ncbi:MAG: hypothetical protein WD826_05975 [Actinomycetota bacterium]
MGELGIERGLAELIRRVVLVLAVLMLGVGPWIGLAYRAPRSAEMSLFTPSGAMFGAVPGPRGERILAAPPISRATGCSCRQVIVEATNVVEGADLRSGDAKFVNRSITYIAPTFDGDDEIEVDQEAEAHSGDAVVGQILAVDAGEGCARVHITARNLVKNSDARTGDAIAKNKSVILIDPRIGLKEGDLEIEVDQEAVATTGDAVAGQILGVKGGGGPCGGVIIDALNDVRNVDLRSGDAITDNSSVIMSCLDIGCIDDIASMLRAVDEVQLCAYDKCESVPVEEFVEYLKNPPPAPDPADDDRDDDPDDEAHEKEEAKRRELEARKQEAWERMLERHPDRATDTAVESTPASSDDQS